MNAIGFVTNLLEKLYVYVYDTGEERKCITPPFMEQPSIPPKLTRKVTHQGKPLGKLQPRNLFPK